MYDICPIHELAYAPLMHLIDIGIMFDDDRVFNMILNKDLREVSPFSWQRLMTARPDLFTELCDTMKFDPNRLRQPPEDAPDVTQY